MDHLAAQARRRPGPCVSRSSSVPRGFRRAIADAARTERQVLRAIGRPSCFLGAAVRGRSPRQPPDLESGRPAESMMTTCGFPHSVGQPGLVYFPTCVSLELNFVLPRSRRE